MKKIIILLSFSVLASLGFSQQDQQFSQFMHNKLSFNPGYAGTNGALCAVAMYRMQWMGFDGAPKSLLFSLDAPSRALHGGLGLTVIQDQLGNDKSLFARGAYSFHQPIGSVGVLGIGIGVGMIQKTLIYNWLPPDGQSSIQPDASIPDAKESSITYDLDFGLYYTTPKLYVGLASTHLPEQDVTKNQMNFGVARHYFVLAGYTFDITGDIQLIPNVLVKSDAKSTIFDLNVTGMYQKMVWLGASYRMTDAIAAMLGYQKEMGKSAFKAGVAYDFTTSDIKNHSNGTPEIVVGYCYKMVPKQKTQSHINPRFLK
ncbi:MAG: PorP/SprF family type IX secretion system membrane protein [Bacteroidia bacterium]|nr:PorP/SprF family type IX secretion system membrane protein [Bacteroidia bacterium]